ncbi:hypothetical protein GCM10025774_26600 [Microbacterium kyungheense]
MLPRAWPDASSRSDSGPLRAVALADALSRRAGPTGCADAQTAAPRPDGDRGAAGSHCADAPTVSERPSTYARPAAAIVATTASGCDTLIA